MRIFCYVMVFAMATATAVWADDTDRAKAPTPDLDDIKARVRANRGYEGRLVADPGVFESRENIRAGRAYDKVISDAFQKRLADEGERIKNVLQAGQPAPAVTGGTATDKPAVVFTSQERVYVFVSSSMPMETLRAYAADIDRLADPNIYMVMRGMVGGISRVAPTKEFFAKIASRVSSCDMALSDCELRNLNMIVDPMLFHRYGIVEVPAMVYVPVIAVNLEGSEGRPENARIDAYHVRYGDAPLAWHLDVFHKKTKMASLDTARRRIVLAADAEELP